MTRKIIAVFDFSAFRQGFFPLLQDILFCFTNENVLDARAILHFENVLYSYLADSVKKRAARFGTKFPIA